MAGGRRRESELTCRLSSRAVIRVARATPPVGQVIVRAWQGREAEVCASAVTAIEETTERRQSGVLIYAKYSLAVLELSLGNYQEALHAREVEHEELVLLVHDLTAGPRRGRVRGRSRTCARRRGTTASRSRLTLPPSAVGMLARVSALLSDDNEPRGTTSRRSGSSARVGGALHRRVGSPFLQLRRPEAPPKCTCSASSGHRLIESLGADRVVQLAVRRAAPRNRRALAEALGRHAQRVDAARRTDRAPRGEGRDYF